MNYYGNLTFLMCLPRSRSAWLVETFKPFVRHAWHEPLCQVESIDEFGERIDSLIRDTDDQPALVADTAAVLFYPQIAARFPNARFLFVERFVHHVAKSLRNAGLNANMRELEDQYRHYMLARNLAYQSRRFVYEATYADLDDPAVVHAIWQFLGLTAQPPPPATLNEMIWRNVQVPVSAQRAAMNPDKAARLLATRREGW